MTPEEIEENKVVQLCYDHLDKFVDIYPKDRNADGLRWENKRPEKVKLTGKKMLEKEIDWYTGYPGGRKVANPKTVLAKQPHKLLERSIKGMLPHNKLGSAMYKKLFVYAGTEHPHAAQKPKTLK